MYSNKRKADANSSSRDGESILFVTSRAVKVKKSATEAEKRAAVKGDISQTLTNLLSQDAVESFHEHKRMKMDNLRIGTARNADEEKPDAHSESWECDILEDAPGDGSIVDTVQAREAFEDVAQSAKLHSRPILLLVHGYNNAVTTPLRAASVMRAKYNCEVIVFMWPTEGQLLDYDKDREDAKLTARPFLRFMRKAQAFLGSIQDCPKITLMCHSMGNYVLEQAIADTPTDDDQGVNVYLQEGKEALCVTPSLVSNIILTAADVDSDGHKKWVQKLHPRGKVFICINRGDKVLWMSDMVAGRMFVDTHNPLEKIFMLGEDHPPRLGQTLADIHPTRSRIYVDVNVTWKHALDFGQLRDLEHSYHYEGLKDIADFYKDAIHGSWDKHRSYQVERKNYNGHGYYYYISGPANADILG